MVLEIKKQKGIILKKIPFSDADEIITVLLREEGMRRFFVPGSRKSKKRFQGLIDHFNHLHFFYKDTSQGLARLNEVEIVNPGRAGLWHHLQGFGLAHYLAELICDFTPEAVHDPGLYDIWLEMEELVVQNCLGEGNSVELILKVLEKSGYGLPDSEDHDLLALVHFSERIMQRKSRAAGFLLGAFGNA